jgi:hypothetical protein
MSAEDSFQTLKRFFETRKAAGQALKAIKEGVEIGIVIGDVVECAVFRRGETPVIEHRAAQNPDVVFHIRPESVTILDERTKDEIGDIGVNVLKEVLAGNIRIKVPGRFLNLLSRGYLDMIRQGGTPVMGFLAQHGLASVSKITTAIKRMKS